MSANDTTTVSETEEKKAERQLSLSATKKLLGSDSSSSQSSDDSFDDTNKKVFNFRDDHADDSCDGSLDGAFVGTSNYSEHSFREYKNLDKFSLKHYGSEIDFPNENELSDSMASSESEEEEKDDKHMSALEAVQRVAAAQYISGRWKGEMRRNKMRNIKYENTYRLGPKDNERVNITLLTNRVRALFERLIDKNAVYEPAYTPKFLRVATELIKKEVKSFRFNRYKVITIVTILQKVVSQSFILTSTCLWNHDTDREICVRYDTKNYYAVCAIYLSYYE